MIEANELLFSWLGTSSLLSTVVSLILSYFLIVIAKSFVVENGTKNLFIGYSIISLILFVSLISLFNPRDIKNTSMYIIERIMIPLLLVFTIIYAITEKNNTVTADPQKIKISFKSDYLNKLYQNKCEPNIECKSLETKELYYIGKTNSVIIATDNAFNPSGVNTFITI